jgi:hypothetical protein
MRKIFGQKKLVRPPERHIARECSSHLTLCQASQFTAGSLVTSWLDEKLTSLQTHGLRNLLAEKDMDQLFEFTSLRQQVIIIREVDYRSASFRVFGGH